MWGVRSEIMMRGLMSFGGSDIYQDDRRGACGRLILIVLWPGVGIRV